MIDLSYCCYLWFTNVRRALPQCLLMFDIIGLLLKIYDLGNKGGYMNSVIDIICGPSLVESLGQYMVNLVVSGAK